MKKNKMLRAAFCLLIAVMTTCSVVGGTFARYATQDKFSDSARVANWGITAAIDGSLFGEHYYSADDEEYGDQISVSITASVDAVSGTGNVVAPGTSNYTGLSLSVSGKPEVKVYAKLNTTHDSMHDIYIQEGKYCLIREIPSENVNITNYSNFAYHSESSVDDGDTPQNVAYNGLNNNPATLDQYNNFAAGDGVFCSVTELVDFKASELDKDSTYACYRFHNGAYYPIIYNYSSTIESSDRKCYSILDLFGEDDENGYDSTNEGEFRADLATEIGTRNVTWNWPFSENNRDLDDYVEGCDTLLGLLAADTEGNDYAIGYWNASTETWQFVKTRTITPADGSPSYIEIYLQEEIPNQEEQDNAEVVIGCLTAAFNARITVGQVD